MCYTITNTDIPKEGRLVSPEEISMNEEGNRLDSVLGLNLMQNDLVLTSARDLILSSSTQDPVLNSVLGSILAIMPDSAEGPIPDPLLEALVDSVPEPCLWIEEETNWTMT